MDTNYSLYTVVVVLLCALLHAVNAQEALLGVEAWAAIGLIGGIVVLIIGLIWVVFCIMLYRHHKERQGDDEDVNKGKEKEQKKKQKQRREQLSQQTDTELAIQSTEVHGVHSSPLEDLYQAASSILQPPGPTSHSHTQSPLVPESAQPTKENNPPEAVEPSNAISPRSSVPSPSSPKPSDSVPSTFESLFTPPTLAVEAEHGGGNHTGRKLHAQLPNVSSSRLRRLSDVEECDVQLEVSNFPLRYGQRRPSNANRKLSENSDPFSFFSFEPSLLGRNHSEKRDIMPYTKMENPRNYQDHMFGQLSSWPEFN